MINRKIGEQQLETVGKRVEDKSNIEKEVGGYNPDDVGT